MTTHTIEKELKKLDFQLVRHGGKHDVWGDGVREVLVSRGTNKVGTWNKIKRIKKEKEKTRVPFHSEIEKAILSIVKLKKKIFETGVLDSFEEDSRITSKSLEKMTDDLMALEQLLGQVEEEKKKEKAWEARQVRMTD